MKIIKIVIILIILLFKPLSSSAQIVHELLDKIKIEFEAKNYYTSLNFCREIIKLCKEDPVSECWFTNVMKNVYRYKGLSEYEIYKKELKRQRLESAILSLESSYNLYRDADILYMYGYLLAVKSASMKKTTELDGLVKAWKGIIELYGYNNWTVTPELVENLKDYIKIAEKFILPKPSKNYSGKFAQFMILMAYNLADEAQLSDEDKKFFNKYRKKYKKNNYSRLIIGKLTE